MNPSKSSLLAEISPQFAEVLARRGFSIKREFYDEKSFGNILIEAASPEVRVRISRDRGQILADIGGVGRNDWHYLPQIVEVVNPAIRWNQQPPRADAIATALDENYDALCDAVAGFANS